MRFATNHEDAPAFLQSLPFGVFLSIIGPFVLLVTFALPTRIDLLWATNLAKSAEQHLPPLTDSTAITIKRSQCFGGCPEYTLRLSGSGGVQYEGKAWVCHFGARAALADPREVSRLVQAMVATGYFGYTWEKGSCATDSPTVITSLEHAGRSYAVVHYHGDTGAPRWLRKMEEEIDRVAGTPRWLPTYSRSQGARCPTSDGGTRGLTMDEPGEDARR